MSDQKLKIAILVDEIAPGSAPKLIGRPVRGLSQLGNSCEALVLVDNKIREKFSQVYDYHLKDAKIRYLFDEAPSWLKKIDFKFPGFSFFSLHHILSFFIAPLIIKKQEYDIVIAHCQYSAFAALGLKIFRKIPFLLLVWDPSTFMADKVYKKRLSFLYPFFYLGAKLLDKFAFWAPQAVITSGKFHHRQFKKLTDKPLEILAPGCFPQEELPSFSQRERAILTYDRWDIGNVPNVFLDILESLGKKDVTLTIGGFWHPESLLKDFQKEIKRRGLVERVKLLGPLDEGMIIKLCSKAMVHVHPVHEAFGMQSLEAAACGCPIIIPKGSGVTDLFEDGIHGYFPDSSKEMPEAINKIFSDPEAAEKMSWSAWERARNYTWEGYAKKLAKICGRYINETS